MISIEWVRRVEENSDAKKAIDFAQGWNLKAHDAHLIKELEAGIITTEDYPALLITAARSVPHTPELRLFPNHPAASQTGVPR